MSRFIIEHTTIVDGTGGPRWTGDVAVADGFFVPRSDLQPDQCDFVLDGRGLTCTPGFIDTHSHSDIQVLMEPGVSPKIRQGITTEILGQDGVSAAPLPLAYRDAWRTYLSGMDGDRSDLTWDWESIGGYLDQIERGRGSAVNIAFLVPHGNVRMSVVGLEDRPASRAELDRMCRMVDDNLRSGCVGLSGGLIYIPGAFGSTEELIELCRVAAAHHKPFVVHQRSEADDILASMEEIFTIARESGVRVHFSHFKICGLKNRRLRPQMAALLDRAAQEGISVTFDQYPYATGSTTMTALLPPWAQSGGAEKTLERLADPEIRRAMERDIQNGLPGWDNFIGFAGPEHIRVTNVQTEGNRAFLGRTLAEIAAARGRGVCDTVFDLLLEEQLTVSICTEYGAEEDVVFFLRRPEQNVCTDGLFGGKPHPRVYGTFARILEKYVREDRILSLEEAVFKMAGKPAEVFALHDRGTIAPGKRADLLLFDADRIQDHATYLEPRQYPTGFSAIFVNGVPVFQNGESLPNCPGMILRQMG